MIEKDAEDTLVKKYVDISKKDSTYIDLLISGCKFRTECFKRNFWYNGEIAEVGTPRNDILFSKEKVNIANATKKELGIDVKTRVALYAPTFRDSGDQSYVTSLEANRIIDTLKSKFNGDWVLVYRLHPNVSLSCFAADGTIDASNYKDMQALLLASDILLTDYSSVMFDFMLLNNPTFLYAPDYEEYTSKERKVYFKIDELPFDLCTTNDDLVNAIETFDNDEYAKRLKVFMDRIGSYEQGTASQKILEWICKQ